MAIKSAISGEYIITQEDNGAIRICQIFDNIEESLHDAAKSVKLKIDPSWDTFRLGRELVSLFGEGDGKRANIGEYTILNEKDREIETYRVHGNTMKALNKIAEEISFKPKNNWNTRFFGSKLIDFVNGVENKEDESEVFFVINPQMSVKELQDNFKEMFGGHLRIKNGNKRCDEFTDSSTGQHKEVLDANLSEIGCKAEGNFTVDMTVGDFQNKVKEDCGLNVVVATSDDWVAVLPEFTLDGVNNIPRNITKAKMQEILNR